MLNEISNSKTDSFGGGLKMLEQAHLHRCAGPRATPFFTKQANLEPQAPNFAQDQGLLLQSYNTTLSFLATLVEKLVSLVGTLLSAKQSEQAAPTEQVPTLSSAPADAQDSALEETANTENTLATQTSRTLKKQGDFLWKPKAEKDGKLVILLPERLTGQVKSVSVLSADGKKVLAKGKYSGIGNGNREHFRFAKAGSEFPANSIVQIKLDNGEVRTVRIAKPQNRLTR